MTVTENKLSLYEDDLVTKEVFAEQVKRILMAFPKMKSNVGFFEILKERVNAKGFTCKRLTDAVDHLIDTYPYPEVVISAILDFNKEINLYTEFEIGEMEKKYGVGLRKQYDLIETSSGLRYAHLDDIKNHGLKIYKPEVKGKNVKYKNENNNPDGWKGFAEGILTKINKE